MKAIKKYLSSIGKRGGQKTARRGTDYYRTIGKAGAAKRWENYKKLSLDNRCSNCIAVDAVHNYKYVSKEECVCSCHQPRERIDHPTTWE